MEGEGISFLDSEYPVRISAMGIVLMFVTIKYAFHRLSVARLQVIGFLNCHYQVRI